MPDDVSPEQEPISAESVVDAWEAAEGESMRDGHRYTLIRLIESALAAARAKPNPEQEAEAPFAEDALATLQAMTGSDNRGNPWLGVTASVALLQMRLDEAQELLREAFGLGVFPDRPDLVERVKANLEPTDQAPAPEKCSAGVVGCGLLFDAHGHLPPATPTVRAAVERLYAEIAKGPQGDVGAAVAVVLTAAMRVGARSERARIVLLLKESHDE